MTSRALLMGSEDYGFDWCSLVGKSESGLVLSFAWG